MKQIELEAAVENVDIITEFVDEELESLDCMPKAMFQINVAIDELFANISQYAYSPETGTAIVQIDVENDPLSVVITFMDHGKPFNPLEAPEPDVTSDAQDRKIGGLGIFMVRKTMDAIDYEYKDGKNILKIKKVL